MRDQNPRHRSAAASGRDGSGQDGPSRRGRGRGRASGGVRLAGAVIFVCLAVLAGALIARAQSGGGGTDPGVAAAGAPSSSWSSSSAMAAVDGEVTPRGTGTPSPLKSPSGTATASDTATAPATGAARNKRPSPSAAAGNDGVAAAGQRTLTLVNRLNQTIWPAIAADPAHPVSATGWVLPPGASLSFRIPDHWDVRLWARTGCSFDASGAGHCLSGDCGKFQCGGTWGEFPSTLAEFNLNAWNGMDFYDVSLVEGNNLPMWINSYGGSSTDKIDANGCSAAGCTRDANATCPSALQRVRGGHVVACLSACLVLKTDQTCCTGAYAARADCQPSTWPIDSAAVFKKAEPFAYSYVDDDATSVLTCTGECDYRVTWGVSP